MDPFGPRQTFSAPPPPSNGSSSQQFFFNPQLIARPPVHPPQQQPQQQQQQQHQQQQHFVDQELCDYPQNDEVDDDDSGSASTAPLTPNPGHELTEEDRVSAEQSAMVAHQRKPNDSQLSQVAREQLRAIADDVKSSWWNCFRNTDPGESRRTDFRSHIRVLFSMLRQMSIFKRIVLGTSIGLMLIVAYSLGARHLNYDEMTCLDHLATYPDDNFHRHGSVVCVRPQPSAPSSAARVFHNVHIDIKATLQTSGVLHREIIVNTAFCRYGNPLWSLVADGADTKTKVDCWNPLVIHHKQQLSPKGDVITVPYSDAICAALHYTHLNAYCQPVHLRELTHKNFNV